ncbi:MAG: hypothetical protein KDA27_28565, partial [Candidatus Eisenbacteria bacterium]|nr:hypothetical protein [Candidatus Eisenbacteria bacterium]
TPTSTGFGSAVAVDGGWALIGAEALSNPSAHMFKRSSDGAWVEKQVWRGSTLQGFGSSVAIDGDFAFIGVDKNDAVGPETGKVQVLKRSGDTWREHQELFASNATVLNLFGSGMAVQGDILAVSGESDVWVFERNPDTDVWSEVSRLGTLADLSGGIPTLAMDGNTIVAGNIHDSTQGADAGAVQVFARQFNGWRLQQSLRASDGVANRLFGVALDIRGDRIVAGNSIDSSDGSLYIFEFQSNGNWSEVDQIDPPDGVTAQVALGDDYLLATLINGPFGLQTPVDVYHLDPDDGWLRGKRLKSDLTGDNLDHFGEAMFIGDDITLIGRADNSVYPVKTTSAPGSIEASDGAYDNRVRIEWIDQSDREDGYRIYRDGQLIATTGPDADSYNDFDATPGRTHQYGVATWAGNFESAAQVDYGWMEPDGTIAGNVSTRAGAAVENVQVCLDPSPGRSFLFDGDMGRLEALKAHMPATEFTLE